MDLDQEAQAIAYEWQVSVELLENVDWGLEEVRNPSGVLQGYFVRFAENTDRDLLDALGVSPGEFHREATRVVFDDPYPEDDSFYAISDPLPDISDSFDDGEILDLNEPGMVEDWNLSGSEEDYTKTTTRRTDNRPPGEAFITDEHGRVITDELGRGITASTTSTAASNFSDFKFGGSNFTRVGVDLEALAKFYSELNARLDTLESSVQNYRDSLPPRSHNRPPELVEPEPISANQLNAVVELSTEIRMEVGKPDPNPVTLQAHASSLRNIAGSIMLWIGKKLDAGVDGVITWGAPLGAYWMYEHPEKVRAAIDAVVETVTQIAQFLISVVV
ncbi:hypothetical protein [Pararhizobium sp.]|uniref:hypothetical protein n=1 Tax=Pararhizobium sp. TaxID=1977563 RepID=UPI00271D8C66|nr:hypothetical protein [Pararhizobium sp.]MDO9415387.1 hypothetical protein [Pararhizobium sp.]